MQIPTPTSSSSSTSSSTSWWVAVFIAATVGVAAGLAIAALCRPSHRFSDLVSGLGGGAGARGGVAGRGGVQPEYERVEDVELSEFDFDD
jgi:hypothetical protein